MNSVCACLRRGSIDSDDGDAKFGDVALNAPSRNIIRKWLKDARQRMRYAEVVQPLISKARGTQCEICLSRKQLSVECIIPLETLADKFDAEFPDEEFDQVAWKTFWIRHQRYRTVCLGCVTAKAEEERNEALKNAGLFKEAEDEDPAGEYPDWGPVYLSAASKAILMPWCLRASQATNRPG